MKAGKYRTWDSPQFVEPVVDYGPSLTDPSQDVPVERLVERHVRNGGTVLPYGEDLSRVGFTELALLERKALEDLEKLQGEEKASKKKLIDDAAAKRREIFSKVRDQLKAGSPELQALAADLTRILPGFEADVAADEGGGSKA